MADAGKSHQGAIGIKETLTSLIIAFMLAFLFRGFVIEGFQIPTGSMAPTLLGKHIRFQGNESGYNWETGPWTYVRGTQNPTRQQENIKVQDPMSGFEITQAQRRLAAGDRVFVLKYLPLLQQPERWDVVVFKNPGQHINYIKRLIGLPGEQLAIVDGDVFARPYVEGQTASSGWDAWTTDDWQIQRKPERIQRAMLQEIFDSSYAPTDMTTVGYDEPFRGGTSGWSDLRYARAYTYEGAGATSLEWNGDRPITDFNAYNQTHASIDLFAANDERAYNTGVRPFPTSDLALSCNIRSAGAGVVASPTIETKGMALRAQIDLGSGTASVMMRDTGSEDSPWTQLDSGTFGVVGAGEWAKVEFWHIDQALWVFVDGKLIAGGAEKGAYELTPAQRAIAATGKSWDELQVEDAVSGPLGVFHRTDLYRKPEVRWDFEGGAFELSHVRVQRDIGYHINQGTKTRGAHPEFFPTMSSDQFFMSGDNSSNSADSRLWGENDIYPWVREEIDGTPGVVNRDLIVGKAFVVYFPAPLDGGPLLSIDFGRLRWIW